MEPTLDKKFVKIVEKYKEELSKFQKLQGAFVNEKNIAKKETLRKALIAQSKKVKQLETEFNHILTATEDLDSLEESKLPKRLKNLVSEQVLRRVIRLKIQEIIKK